MRTANDSGYLKGCTGCGRTIYMKADNDGKWRAYESWVAGHCVEGEWVSHACRDGSTERYRNHLAKPVRALSVDHLHAPIPRNDGPAIFEGACQRDDSSSVSGSGVLGDKSAHVDARAVKVQPNAQRFSPVASDTADLVESHDGTSRCHDRESHERHDIPAVLKGSRQKLTRIRQDIDDDSKIRECRVCGYSFLGRGDACRSCERDEQSENVAAHEQALREMTRGSNDYDWDADDYMDSHALFVED